MKYLQFSVLAIASGGWLCASGLTRAAAPPATSPAAAAVHAAASSEPAIPTEAPRMTAEEVKALVARGRAVVVDVRSAEAYAAEHAAGALSIPLSGLAERLKELPKDKLIAAYCT